MEELTVWVEEAEANWKSLWQSFKSLADFLRSPEDDGRTWAQFVPLISTRLHEFVKRGCHCAVKSVLVHIRVLSPGAPLHKLVEEAESQDYLDLVMAAEPGVDVLAGQLVEQLNIPLPPPPGDEP